MNKNLLIKMTDSEYFAADGYNFSTIKELLVSPLNFWWNVENPQAPTQAMKLGSTIHCWLLEPLKFANEYIEAPTLDKRTKEYKEFAANNTDKFIYDAREVEPIIEAIQRNKGNFEGLDLVLAGKTTNEHCVFWNNYKCKIDAFNKEQGILIDVKTTSEVEPVQFLRTIRKNNYHLQLAHYKNGLESCGFQVNQCKIIAIQNQAPFDVVEYELEEEVMNYAEFKLEALYEKLKEVLLFNSKDGVSNKTINVTLGGLGIC